MAKLMSVPGQCFGNCMLLLARIALFIFCLGLFAIQIAAIIRRARTDCNNEQNRHCDKEPLKKFALFFATVLLTSASVTGAYGAITRNRRTLRVFAFLLVIIFLIRGVTVSTDYHETKQELTKFNTTMRHLQKLYRQDGGSEKDTWDVVQSGFKCCGLVDQYEWIGMRSHSAKRFGFLLPDSCCPPEFFKPQTFERLERDNFVPFKIAPPNHCNFYDSYQVGCLEKFERYLSIKVVLGIIDLLIYFIMLCLVYYIAKPEQTVEFSPSLQTQPADKSQAFVIADVPPPDYSTKQLL